LFLFDSEYFGFKESAFNYVYGIFDFIELEIKSNRYKELPKKLRKYGNYSITHFINERTTWYILFDINENTYNITFIFNNHEKFAQYLDL
jgi:hypothetical protein